MTNQEINISIAERQGWTNRHKTRAGSIVGALNEVSHVPIPNYCGDLNAMHEVEQGLSFTERRQFQKHLRYVLTPIEIQTQCALVNADACIHATARQRAEAYLKTVGGWTGE